MTIAQHRMLKHGLIILLMGLIGGVLMAVNMVGKIALEPLPVVIDYALPGETSRWRAVHVGNLMNGLMAIGLALALPHVSLSGRTEAWVSWGIVGSVWANFVFYVFGVFAPNHGVSISANPLGEASWQGVVAYVPATIAAYVSIAVVILLLVRLKPAA
ncbi:hypothetical protein [Ruegeria sp. Ofav3-42]|uniref:hypothetical protein n=1 Tax=Ruegeria sp. Ofav3-42 TaxID=2917759 RepID=UPI001EF734C1|nr:hypothetical protein [Ruegeria sp. Ofav3-42]MCG7522047.1 hypothetical protein [Ruegeria sp. Ofav3-42]